MKVRDGVELYEIQGKALDNAWLAKNRAVLEDHALDEMRQHGLVPVIDMCPGLTSNFNHEEEIFEFKITMYGYHVGEKAQDYLGILLSDGILVSKDAKRVALCDVEGI